MDESKNRFADYAPNGAKWVTLSSGEFYPDVLEDAVALYSPVLTLFSQLLKRAESTPALFLSISQTKPVWMRIQLLRIFRKYASPATPVEMLKKKTKADWIIKQFSRTFRAIHEIQDKFDARPMPDEAMCALLWEYKSRGQKGYDLTEKMFGLLRQQLPQYELYGPERAGNDIRLGDVFPDYPKHDRPADFVIKQGEQIRAVGFARYDGDRGGSQEDDRTGGNQNAANEILQFAQRKGLNVKVIFVNDGPGLLLGSMWKDYGFLEDSSSSIIVVTLRMIPIRLTEEWLNS